MSALPFPPPPEPGWYADDATVQSQVAFGFAASAGSGAATPRHADDSSEVPTGRLADDARAVDEDAAVGSASGNAADTADMAEAAAARAGTASDEPRADSTSVQRGRGIADSKEDVEDWDGTVLSNDFMMETPTQRYTLHNAATGQSLTIERSTLLGRKPSATVPQGAVSVKLDDPTRTVSRNHAAISFDRNGVLWIEDYGSLNGTYVIRDNVETRVEEGVPLELKAPAVLRLGDQFIGFDEAK